MFHILHNWLMLWQAALCRIVEQHPAVFSVSDWSASCCLPERDKDARRV